jgi:hypothetical protein
VSALVWQDPPASKRGPRTTKHADAAAEMRANPGRWALVGGPAKSCGSANLIRSAKVSAYAPAGSFETTTRRRPDGRFDIYARFVGDPDQTPEPACLIHDVSGEDVPGWEMAECTCRRTR